MEVKFSCDRSDRGFLRYCGIRAWLQKSDSGWRSHMRAWRLFNQDCQSFRVRL